MAKIYHTILYLFALSALIYIGVDVFYRIVEAKLITVHAEKVLRQHKPDLKQHERKPLSYFNTIMDRNMFGSTLKKASVPAKKPDVDSIEPTDLKIALLGTVTGKQENAFAVIEEAGKRRQELYRVGDSIKNAILKTILRGKVILRVGDRDEVLIMEEPSSSKTAKRSRATPRVSSKRTITVRLSDLERSLQNINQLMSNIRIRPHFKGGVSDGLLITRIRARSIFRRLGLRNGDILQEIDGHPIANPDNLFSLYNDLKTGSPVSIQIKRRGRQRILNYRFRE
jgi:general secretion pathway protein C